MNIIQEIEEAVIEYEQAEGVYPLLLVSPDVDIDIFNLLRRDEYRAVYELTKKLFGASVRIRPDEDLPERGWSLK